MIEQYIFNKISADTTLSGLITESAKLHLYPNVIPRGIVFTKAMTFTTISTNDVFPDIKSVAVQFNIFANTHIKTVEIGQALSDLFNEDNNQSSGGVNVIFSQRRSESEIGFDFDDNLFQREATYYFKIR